MAEVCRRGVSVYSGASDLKIEGTDHVTGLTFRSFGRFRRLSATLVALHEGIVPMQHPARVAGLAHQWNGVHAYFQPEVDEYGEASPGGIFVVGDGASILGAKAAEHSGRLAGLRILERLRMLDASTFVELSSNEFKARALHTGWRKFIDTLYAPPDCIDCPGDDIMVCRCEEVLAREIRAIASAGCVGPNQTKALLRSGMGPCQGRICGTVISRLVAETHNREMDDIGHFRIRPPIKPVSLGELSSIETQMLEYPAE
jgi:hypothetical protein